MSKSKQINQLKSSFKKRNYKAFFFFIGFTLLIWLFVQMSKTYDHEVQLTFMLQDLPKQIVIENNTKSIPVEVTQTGFKILSINLFNSTIALDFKELDSVNGSFKFDLKKNKYKISKAIKVPNSEFQISQDSIKFKYYRLATKKLKIKPNFKISFSKGYDSVSNFSFEPSYVEVSGNDTILKNLEYISTVEKKINEVSDSLSGTVDIQKIDTISINYMVESVKYSLPVTKFTEGNFEIPIEVKNNEKNEELVIFPKTVVVNFKTSLSNFEKIDESGFKVIAKYKPDEDFMMLELVKQPKHVKNVSLENYKVDYLIKK